MTRKKASKFVPSRRPTRPAPSRCGRCRRPLAAKEPRQSAAGLGPVCVPCRDRLDAHQPGGQPPTTDKADATRAQMARLVELAAERQADR